MIDLKEKLDQRAKTLTKWERELMSYEKELQDKEKSIDKIVVSRLKEAM